MMELGLTGTVKGRRFKGPDHAGDGQTILVVDVYNLLFSPGFSTKDQVDDFARGVGMDVVRTSLSKIQGAITIDSTLGKEQPSLFACRLP